MGGRAAPYPRGPTSLLDSSRIGGPTSATTSENRFDSITKAPAMRQTTKDAGWTVVADIVSTRVGDLVLKVHSGGFEPVPDLEKVVKAAVAKVIAG